MKATLDIPDDLYRRVKSRSALEGRPVRAVAIALFEQWLASPNASPATKSPAKDKTPRTRFDNAAWVGIARKYVKPGVSHDWADIEESIARGWAAEVGRKLGEKPRTRRP